MTGKVKPKVGQTLYRLNVGNNARHCPQVLTPVVVSKVGRLYFTVKRDRPYAMETKHHIVGWYEKTDGSANTKLYESEQAWADEKEAVLICGDIKSAFEYGQNRANLPIDALRAIEKIIGKEKS